ncbi:MAG: CHASE domain-containing protein [Rhodocyclales bacterium]|nr:CHASE domain-containing protein [Rhodocyclales bacterium]
MSLVLAVTFVVSLLLFLVLGTGVLRGAAESRRAAALHLGADYAQRLSFRLSETMGPVYMLASLVQRHRGMVPDFDRAAAEIIALFPMVSSIQLAPNGVVSAVFPLAGNESVPGTDLLKNPARRQEAQQTIARRQLMLGGPYTLTQGGVGVIGRFPVFLPDENGWGKFWGFTIVVVRLPQLLDAGGLPELTRDGYRYELCRVIDDEGGCDVFSRRGEGAPVDPAVVSIEVPNGTWKLRLAPEEGWNPPLRQGLLIVVSVVMALLVTLLQFFLIRRFGR